MTTWRPTNDSAKHQQSVSQSVSHSLTHSLTVTVTLWFTHRHTVVHCSLSFTHCRSQFSVFSSQFFSVQFSVFSVLLFFLFFLLLLPILTFQPLSVVSVGCLVGIYLSLVRTFGFEMVILHHAILILGM